MLKRLTTCAAISSLLYLLVASPCLDTAIAEEPERKVTRIKMTTAELRAMGINVRTTKSNALPHSCAAAGNSKLSISDNVLAHYEARGFSLEAVCLALSSFVRFDMETGKQLPIAVLADIDPFEAHEVALDFPDCFKGGTPYLDCRQVYSEIWGNKHTKKEQAEVRETAGAEDRDFRAFIARKKISGRFSIEDLGRGIFDSRFEWILASDALPRGYGYALHGPEGDDPEIEDVSLETYRKKSSSGVPWNEKR